MLGELQKQKLAKMFQLVDTNQNGFLSKEDFDDRFQLIAEASQTQQSSPEYERLRASFEADWEALKVRLDTNGDGRVSLEEWLMYYADMLSSDGGYEEIIVKHAEATFDADDTNGDGMVDISKFLKARKWPDSDAAEEEEIRRRFDPNGDGYMEKQDLLPLLREFYFSNDPNADGNWYIGRL